MILDKKQQISFISMCNSAMEDTHKNKKSDQHKNKATKSNGRTEKQITMVNKLEERKVKYSKNSETENYSSQCDTEIEEKEKEEKANPLSKLFNRLSSKLIKKDKEENIAEQQGHEKDKQEENTDEEQG